MNESLTLTLPLELVEAIAQRVAELVHSVDPAAEESSPWLDVAGACRAVQWNSGAIDLASQHKHDAKPAACK